VATARRVGRERLTIRSAVPLLQSHPSDLMVAGVFCCAVRRELDFPAGRSIAGEGRLILLEL
jgi:hypothetical protein